MRRSVAFVLAAVFAPPVMAQSTDRVIPQPPQDAPKATPERRQLFDALLALPVPSEIPQGWNHTGDTLRYHEFAIANVMKGINECEIALENFYTIRRYMQLAVQGKFPAEEPRLQDHLAHDSDWLTTGWSTCQKEYGWLFNYKPLPKNATKEQIAADTDMNEDQCVDLEDRIIELENGSQLWNGKGRWAGTKTAKADFDALQNRERAVKYMRIRCPASVAAAKALIAKGGFQPLPNDGVKTWTPPPAAPVEKGPDPSPFKAGKPSGAETVKWLAAKVMNYTNSWSNPIEGVDYNRTVAQSVSGDCNLHYKGSVKFSMSNYQEPPDRYFNVYLPLKDLSAAEITSVADPVLTSQRGPMLYFVRIKTGERETQIFFESQDLADRTVKALGHLLELCGSEGAHEAF